MASSRRDFLKQSAFATVGTMLIPGFLKAFESQSASKGEKKLVILQLSGGNDGLNTIVPYRNDLYYKFRPQVSVVPEKVLKISDDLGFHPSLASLRTIYDKGYMGILNNVGYPNPDRSHFRSMDIWQTASDAAEYLQTGWIGRYLDASCIRSGSAAAHGAIEIDDTLSLAMKGETNKGMAMRNPKKLYDALHRNHLQELKEAHSTSSAPEEPTVSYLYKTLAESISSADYIYARSKIVKTRATYPETAFANELKTIAQLILSGIDTQVYYASLSGFDTHIRQVPQHVRLLGVYAEAVSSFISDLETNGALDQVLVMVFSEFGRRVAENASGGTDHGTANNVFLISKSLKKQGFINQTPDLHILDQGDLVHTIDFRSIYATILDEWLKNDSIPILGKRFEKVGFI